MSKIPQETLPVMVIVVEGDRTMRSFAVDTLIGAGFGIIEAPGTTEALAILAFRAAEVDILFTDLDLRGNMTGLELACHVRVNWPWISVMATSIRLQPVGAEPLAFSRFLTKPYRMTDVVAQMREVSRPN
jgi:DNA-binding response OmpR family regulator